MSFIWASSTSTYSDPLYSTGNQRPTLDLQFARGKSLNDYASGQNLVTFTRDSIGTYVDENGLIQTATANTPRFDHDPETLESLGLLVEESRTNLHWFSNTFSNSGVGGPNPRWQDFANVTLQEQTYPDPAGGNTATRIIPTTTLGSHYIGRYSAYGTGTYTYSIFVKPQGYSKFGISMNGVGPNVDLSVNPPVFTGETSTRYGNKIEKLPSGWYRVSFTWVNNAPGNGANTFQPRITILDNTGSSNFSGDGVSGIDVYGFQSEIGSFPTSYIPTSGSAVTRAADVASITGSNYSVFTNLSEGTWFSQVNSITPSSGGRIFDSRINSSSTSILIASANSSGYSYGSNGTVQINASYPLKGAVSYNTSQVNGAANGVLSTNNTGARTANHDHIDIGSANTAASGVGFINAPIARITYWSKRLDNATLQTITS